jgi:hypothetical protein
MSAWWNLLKKEYRATRTSAIISLSILIAGGLWLVYLSQRYNAGVIIGPASFLLIFLMFYPAIYLLKSLSWEFKVTPHLWLHCPQPAWLLLLAKLTNGLFQMLIIMIIASVLLLWGVLNSPLPGQLSGIVSSPVSFFIEIGFYVAVIIIAAGIYIGAWATFISVVSATAKNILGRFRWLAGIAAFLAATWGMGQLQQTWIFQKVTNWGLLHLRLQSLENFPEAYSGMHLHLGQIYTGQILFYILFTVALFALSVWLIDNKVEV